MTPEKVYQMPYRKVYPLLVAKAERKGRTRAEVDTVIRYLTGYDQEALDRQEESDITYGDFFTRAPAPNPARVRITGSVCGVRVEQVEEPLMREIRYLDELAKGRPMEKILRT